MKYTKFIILIGFAGLFLNMQCDEDDVQSEVLCDSVTIIDSDLYQNAESDFYSLISAEINDDCLDIEISASGCSGETWMLELIDSGGVMESLPPQRNLKLVLTNNEACLAVFSSNTSFDLTELRIEEDGNEVILNIEGFPEPLTYLY